MSVDASREILKNRSSLAPNVSLEDVLRGVRSRNALTFTNSQLKNIRDNLALEKKGLLDKVDIESKVLDSTLNGLDTKQKAADLSNKLKELEISKVAQPNTKTLDTVVSNISNIKKN